MSPDPASSTAASAISATTSRSRAGRRRPRCEVASVSLSAGATSSRLACRAGSNPDQHGGERGDAEGKRESRGIEPDGVHPEPGEVGSRAERAAREAPERAERADVRASRRPMPAAPPRSASTVLSTNSCFTTWARRAPSASRTAISRRRAVARASRRPAEVHAGEQEHQGNGDAECGDGAADGRDRSARPRAVARSHPTPYGARTARVARGRHPPRHPAPWSPLRPAPGKPLA